MSNNQEYYNHGNYPQQGTVGSSAALRAELEIIEAGLNKLPALTGNPNKLVKVSTDGSGLEASTVISDNGTDATVAGDLYVAGGQIGQNAGQKHNIPLVANDTLALLDAPQALTNKSLNLLNNAVTGTLAQFNAALSGADFVSLAGAESLTNKAISAATNTITTAASGGLVATNLNAALAELDAEQAAYSASLAASTGSSLVGNDGAGLWTTIAGFIGYLKSSLGAAIVGFIQNGVGAVARTVQAKLRESLSVDDFTGVDNTGVADSTAGIQAAITAAIAANKNLVFPNKYLINGTINIPSSTISFIGNPSNTITLGTLGTINFTSNATNVCLDGLYFYSNSTLPIFNFVGTGGLFININKCKFYSSNSSTVASTIVILGAFGSFNDCEFNLGTGNQDAVRINASSANIAFNNCHSYGRQTRSFSYLDGSTTAFGVQGIRYISCTLLNYNNGIIADAGVSGTVDSVIISGCMVDSMMQPIKFTNVLNGCVSGSYIGGNSGTLSPIELIGCTQFTMTGCNAEAYGASFTVTPPPRLIAINGGNDVRFIGNGWKLSGNTGPFTAGSILPSLLSMISNQGVLDFIAATPTQFDSSSTLATTAFVARAARIFSGQKLVTGSTTLLISDAGSFINCALAAPATLTLPLASAAPAFRASFFIYNYNASTLTLAPSSGDNIRVTLFTLAQNTYIELINNPGANQWMVASRGAI